MLSVEVENMETGDDHHHPSADDGHLHEDGNHIPSAVDDDTRLLNLEVEMVELLISDHKILNIEKLAWEFNDLGLEQKSLDVNLEGLGGRNSTPLKERGRVPGEWEADANLWLTGLVLSIDDFELKSNLVAKFATIQKGPYNHFCFGEEIKAHQDLERCLFKENISTHHILDYFDRDLTTQCEPNRTEKCTDVQLCCLGRELPSPTVKDITSNPLNNSSSRDTQEDTLCQEDRSQEDWMCVEYSSQEHQDNIDFEMRSTGKFTNNFYDDSGTCNQPTWVRRAGG